MLRMTGSTPNGGSVGIAPGRVIPTRGMMRPMISPQLSRPEGRIERAGVLAMPAARQGFNNSTERGNSNFVWSA